MATLDKPEECTNVEPVAVQQLPAAPLAPPVAPAPPTEPAPPPEKLTVQAQREEKGFDSGEQGECFIQHPGALCCTTCVPPIELVLTFVPPPELEGPSEALAATPLAIGLF